MVRLSVSLPWVNDAKYRQETRRENARRQAAEFDAADYELSLREELRRLTAGIDASRREALLYRDEIIPRSVQALASAEASWAANRALFLDVLEARRMLVDARLTYARAVTEQYRLLTELVLCCGLGDLEALEMIGAQPEVSPPSVKP
jgi:outer membrane protein TolC